MTDETSTITDSERVRAAVAELNDALTAAQRSDFKSEWHVCALKLAEMLPFVEAALAPQPSAAANDAAG